MPMTYKKPNSSTAMVMILVIVIIGIWCWFYNRMSLETWEIPLRYFGDSLWTLGTAKAYLDGDAVLIFQKLVHHLNAPFSANWNDFPGTEDIIYASMGWLGRLIGIFASANVITLLGHILAGLSFWYVARVLGCKVAFSSMGAVLFAFTPHLFVRNLGHTGIAYYWHVPLFLLITWWAFAKGQIILGSRNWWIAAGISVITGALNPYYSVIYLQFLSFAFLLHLIRKQWAEMRIALILGLITIIVFLLLNAGTISYQLTHGSNSGALIRPIDHLITFGLKLPDLFMPHHSHHWHWWADFWESTYFSQIGIKGEGRRNYLGFVGIIGFLWLIGLSVFRLLQGKLHHIPVQAWQTLWIILYALVGGINLLAGVAGFVFLRATNRYSIIILSIALLFLIGQLSKYCKGKYIWPVALVFLAFGLWDQLPRQSDVANIEKVKLVMQSDREFVKSLTAALPTEGKVFQLPVMDFPEALPIHKMEDYEHIRPYLFSKGLHFSYGSNKGRTRELWQRDVEKMPPQKMAATLEAYGFSAIYINTKGFEDRGTGLIEGLTAAGKPVITRSNLGDLIALRLTPSPNPSLP